MIRDIPTDPFEYLAASDRLKEVGMENVASLLEELSKCFVTFNVLEGSIFAYRRPEHEIPREPSPARGIEPNPGSSGPFFTTGEWANLITMTDRLRAIPDVLSAASYMLPIESDAEGPTMPRGGRDEAGR